MVIFMFGRGDKFSGERAIFVGEENVCFYVLFVYDFLLRQFEGVVLVERIFLAVIVHIFNDNISIRFISLVLIFRSIFFLLYFFPTFLLSFLFNQQLVNVVAVVAFHLSHYRVVDRTISPLMLCRVIGRGLVGVLPVRPFRFSFI